MKKSNEIFKRHRTRILEELRGLTDVQAEVHRSVAEREERQLKKWNMMLTLSSQEDEELEEIFYDEFKKQYLSHTQEETKRN